MLRSNPVRPGEVARDVAPVELFFDLVYVFADTQLVFGGPALFLLSQVAFFGTVGSGPVRSRLIACAALVVLALATTPLSLFAAVLAATAAVTSAAIADTVTRRRPAG